MAQEGIFVSAFAQSMANLLKSPDFQALSELYDQEEKTLMRELIAATDDRALRLIQGKAKMLRKIRTLPEETVDRFIKERGQ